MAKSYVFARRKGNFFEWTMWLGPPGSLMTREILRQRGIGCCSRTSLKSGYVEINLVQSREACAVVLANSRNLFLRETRS